MNLTESVPNAAVEPAVDPAAAQRHDAWFVAGMDPWDAVVLLEEGGDRTAANTVERLVLAAESAQRPALEQRMLHVALRPELTDAGRRVVCRVLSWIGGPASVVALAPWLEHERTADDARYALDPLEDPSVDAAYRAALPKVRGRALIGLIGSLAERRDRAAIEGLTAIAVDTAQPMDVRAAAETAVKFLARLA